MEPGPDSIGMAIGVSEMSCLVRASLLSSIVMRLEPVTMPQAVFATIKPPAIFRTGNEIPKKPSTNRPKSMKTIRIAITYREVFSAVLLRSCGGKFAVRLKNSGIPPKGLTIGRSARKVAVAAVGRSCSTWRRAVSGLIAIN